MRNLIKRALMLTIMFVFLVNVLFFYRFIIIGNASLSIEENYDINEKLTGTITVSVNDGDMIQKDIGMSLRLEKGGEIMKEPQFTISQFIDGLGEYAEINSTIEVCVNISVISQREICENVTIETTAEVCEEQINENNETVIVCRNETSSSIIQNCTMQDIETIEQNCTAQETSDYYYNSAGVYSRSIADFIDYNFTLPGVYSLIFEILSLNLIETKTLSVARNESFGILAENFSASAQANLSTTVYQCGTLDSPGTYTVNQSITNNSLTGSCIIINAQNVTLRCQGYFIISNDVQSQAGIYSNQINTTIRNCNITMGTSNGVGISLDGASQSTLIDNFLNNQSYGLEISNANNIQAYNLTVNGNSLFGIFLQSSSGNTLSGLSVKDNGVRGIYLVSSLNNIIIDSNLSNPSLTDVYLLISTNNTFLNVNYSNGIEYVSTNSELIRKWYYRAFVNDTTGTAGYGVNITAYNVSGTYAFNLTTNASGWTQLGQIIDYVNTGGTRSYYSNYTINASKTGYNSTGHLFNSGLGNNLFDIFTLADFTPPSVNITYPLNKSYSLSSITFNVSTDETATCLYSLNSGINNATMSTTNNRSYNATNSSIGEGNYLARAYCNDSGGYMNNSERVNFTIDRSAPVINLISVSDAQSYNFNVSDVSNIDNCSLVLNGTIAANDSSILKNTAETITYSTPAGTYTYRINCTDSAGNIGSSDSSTLTVSVTNTVTTVPSGGGGGSVVKYRSLKIIFPEDLSIRENESIVADLKLVNEGQVSLEGINLTSIVRFNDAISNGLRINVLNAYINKILPGESQNVSLIIASAAQNFGRYKVSINADVASPKFSDSGEFFIDIRSISESEIDKILSFSEQLLFDNPKCIELTEVIKEAEKLYAEGSINESISAARSAVEACKKAISYGTSVKRSELIILMYTLIASILVLAAWFAVYFYKKVKLNKSRKFV